MAISEAQRADLYTGLAEVLGPDRAELLMTQLPRFDPIEVATKADIAELKDGMRAVNQRLDRLFLTLLAGLFGMIAAMAVVLFVVG